MQPLLSAEIMRIRHQELLREATCRHRIRRSRAGTDRWRTAGRGALLALLGR